MFSNQHDKQKQQKKKMIVFTNFFDAKYSHHGQFQAINVMSLNAELGSEVQKPSCTCMSTS